MLDVLNPKQLLEQLIRHLLVIIIIEGIVTTILMTDTARLYNIVGHLVAILFLYGIRYLVLHRDTRRASLILVSGIWMVYTGLAILTGETSVPALSGYIIVITITGLLLGRTRILVFSGLSLVVAISLYFTQQSALFAPLVELSGDVSLVSSLVTLVIITDIIYLVSESLNSASSATAKFDTTLSQINRQAETASAQREQIQLWMEAMLQYLPIMLGVFAPDGTIKHLSGAGIANELNPNEVVGQPIAVILHDAPEMRAEIKRAFNDEIIYTPPRQWRGHAYENYYYPIKDAKGTVKEVLLLSIDSTEQYRTREELEKHIQIQAQAEQALRESEAQLQIIFDEALDIFVVINDKEEIVRTNAVVEPVLGYSADELIGQSFSTLLPPDNMPRIATDLSSNDLLFDALPFVRKDGTLCPMELTATVIPWQNDVGILITLRDVSKREEMRRELEESREQMQYQQDLIEARLNVIFMVAHQLRNPLAIILASTEIIERHWERLEILRRLNHLEKIKAQTIHLRQMMTDMLAARDAMDGKLNFLPQVLNLEQYCHEQFESFVAAQNKDNHTFEIDCQIKTLHALLDKTLLNYILDNLLTNAVKYSPGGGEVSLKVTETNANFVIAVADEGIGIPDSAQEYLFDMFYRADNVQSIKGTGIGLGLAFMSAKAHHGTITYMSTEGQGTTFYVHIPVQLPDAHSLDES